MHKYKLAGGNPSTSMETYVLYSARRNLSDWMKQLYDIIGNRDNSSRYYNIYIDYYENR
jgi:hypothetical protein